jgi:hypothetical protein
MDTVGSSRAQPEPVARAQAVPRDCRIAKASRSNLFLIGRTTRVEPVIDALWPGVAHVGWRPGRRLWFPFEAETFVLYDVDCLWRGEQRRLMEWLTARGGRTQLVTTSTEPLTDRVQANAFLDTLYYRLNTVCVDLRDEPPPARDE